MPTAQIDQPSPALVDYPEYRDEISVVERVVGPPIRLRQVMKPASLTVEAAIAAVLEKYPPPHMNLVARDVA